MRTRIVFFIAFLFAGFAQGQELTIATYNMRYDNPNDSLNSWRQRLPVIGQLIRFHDFDIFGGQELLTHQIEGLKEQLPAYNWFGVGRDDGQKNGEYSPIFYKKDQYTLVKSGTFWLAPKTDAPGKGWDAALPRVCTWGEFETKKDKKKFFVFNTHFDHRGEQARLESARLILEKIKQMTGSTPVILMGDFNFDQDHEGYRILSSSALKDCYMIAPIKLANTSTFNSFDIKTGGNRRIDHIFLSSQFNIKKYGILTDSYQGGKLPSDHYPVMAEIVFEK
jgi:endonuclease/exonuclease/phosphatase family metal-dependent hydrolase